MRRRYIGVILVLGFVFLLLFFNAYEYRIVGTWKGNGDIDIVGMETSFEFAESLIFTEDGTAIAVVGEEQRSFDFSMTDDTLTLTDKETKTSYGIFYRLIGNRLVLKTGGGNSSEFIRM